MILTCPNCNARFLVNSAAMHPAGREVRCGRCRHQWFARPEGEPASPPPRAEKTPGKPAAPAAEASPPPPPPESAGGIESRAEPEPEVEAPVFIQPRPLPPGSNLPALTRPKRRVSAGRMIGWILLALVLIGIGVVLAERDRLMALYPQTRGVFAAIGFDVPPPGDGLQISNVVSSRTVQEGVPVLVSEGRITNVTGIERHVPLLRGALRDSAGRELQSWTFAAAESRLAPGESVPFRTEVRQPATTAAELSITFIAGN